jgi:restriction system protein
MMNDRPIWILGAGEGAAYADEFLEQGLVAIGWSEAEAGDGRAADATAERRFCDEIEVGDAIATHDRESRRYRMGRVASEARWRDHDLPRWREVKWSHEVTRDALSLAARNGLGSMGSMFRLPAEIAAEMWGKALPLGSTVEDRLARLDWKQMQELVAGILRAMGYRTRLATDSPDRGVDIFASPDGLGLEEPRVFVEVKHRRNEPMGATQIRAFLGGRNPSDRCLYVSTGGFSKAARKEAERSQVPLKLLSLGEVRDLFIEFQGQLDGRTRALVPVP